MAEKQPFREVATKDHSSSNPAKGKPPRPKNKADFSKVDAKGFPTSSLCACSFWDCVQSSRTEGPRKMSSMHSERVGRKGCARNPPERSSCEIFRRDRRKMRRNFGEIFVLQFPGKMAAHNFTKNPRHFPRCTKLSFFTAATLGASGPKKG